MNDKLKDPLVDRLFDGILSLQTREDCYSFFEDLCTIAELKSLAQRLQVAELLNQGKTYQEIFEITKVSTATISRVNRSLEYGSDGYVKVLRNLQNLEKNDLHTDKI